MEDNTKEEIIMKALRALYMLVVDILALPIMALFVIVMVVINVVHCVRHEYGMTELMRFTKAIAEGFDLGIEHQLYWVNHGKDAEKVYRKDEGLD